VYLKTNQKQRGSEEQEQEESLEEESEQVIEEEPMISILRKFKKRLVGLKKVDDDDENNIPAMDYIQLLSLLLEQSPTYDEVEVSPAEDFKQLIFETGFKRSGMENLLLNTYKFTELSSIHPDMPYSVIVFILGSLYPYFYNCIHRGKRSPFSMFNNNDNCAFNIGTMSFMKSLISILFGVVNPATRSSSSKGSSGGGSKTKRRNKKPYNNLKTRANTKLKIKSSRKHRKSSRKHTFTQRHK